MPRTLILEPTRELAAQVAENFEKYGKNHKLNVALLIGGVSFDDQDRKLERGADVLICTPGRLLDHCERGKLLMTGVEILVIDEADRMLDMGFIPDIERIAKMIPFTRQTLFFSATMPPEIQKLADTFLQNPERDRSRQAVIDAKTVTQRLVARHAQGLGKARDAARPDPRSEADIKNAIIFCNRKKDVADLFRSLERHGFRSARCMATWTSVRAPPCCRISATASSRCSSPPTSPPAASTFPMSATSSISTCRSMPRTMSTASAAPVAPAALAPPSRWSPSAMPSISTPSRS